MTYYVNVEPPAEQRVTFAQAAVSADPYTAMAGHGVFRVRHDIFLGLAEELLVGALIDGTVYRPFAEEPAEEQPSVVIEPDLTCADCGKVAGSPAGLAAHRRAKHEGE